MASEPPKVLISYSHDSPAHAEHVLELADRLRGDGIDCMIDQYVVAPAEGWPRWMDKQIRDSDFVLMVCTETYYQRVMAGEGPGKGLGVRWEGQLIYQAIYRAESMNTMFIPVLFESGNYAHIPAPVQSTTFYFARTEEGYEELYRRLTNQPRALKPALGKLRGLPAVERKSEGGAHQTKSPITETKIPFLQYERPVARVLVSHSSKDKSFVRKLVEALEKHLLNVRIDEHEIKVGDSIVGKISETLKDVDYLVIVLSQASISCRWVEQELNVVLTNQISGKGVVLPVLLENCELPMLLRDRLYADFRVDFDVGLRALLAAFEHEGESAVDVTPSELTTATPASITPARLRANFQGLLRDQMSRPEVGRLWYAVLETPMKDEMGQRPKSDCVVELLERAKNRNKLPRLTEELHNIRPDLTVPSPDSPDSAGSTLKSPPQTAPRNISSETTSPKAAETHSSVNLLRGDKKWWFLGFGAHAVAALCCKPSFCPNWKLVRRLLNVSSCVPFENPYKS
jgi:hypothetical protein